MKTAETYLVSGIIRNRQIQEYYEAMSVRQACYRFCREHGLDEAEDVPALKAVCISGDDDIFVAANGGFLI